AAPSPCRPRRGALRVRGGGILRPGARAAAAGHRHHHGRVGRAHGPRASLRAAHPQVAVGAGGRRDGRVGGARGAGVGDRDARRGGPGRGSREARGGWPRAGGDLPPELGFRVRAGGLGALGAPAVPCQRPHHRVRGRHGVALLQPARGPRHRHAGLDEPRGDAPHGWPLPLGRVGGSQHRPRGAGPGLVHLHPHPRAARRAHRGVHRLRRSGRAPHPGLAGPPRAARARAASRGGVPQAAGEVAASL
ncbi:MAG: Gll0911 protein, partial [uncultured Gemmatimonadetes bacterium]